MFIIALFTICPSNLNPDNTAASHPPTKLATIYLINRLEGVVGFCVALYAFGEVSFLFSLQSAIMKPGSLLAK